LHNLRGKILGTNILIIYSSQRLEIVKKLGGLIDKIKYVISPSLKYILLKWFVSNKLVKKDIVSNN